MAQETTIATYVLTLTATGLGTIIGAYATYLSAKAIATHNDRLMAAANFRNALSPTISFITVSSKYVVGEEGELGKTNSREFTSFVHSSWPHISTATCLFRPYISAKDITEYDKAYDAYYSAINQNDLHVYCFGAEGREKYLLTLLHTLLKFAQPQQVDKADRL